MLNDKDAARKIAQLLTIKERRRDKAQREMAKEQQRRDKARQVVDQQRQVLADMEAHQNSQLQAMEVQMAAAPISAHAFEAIRAQERAFIKQREVPQSELQESMESLKTAQATLEETAQIFRLKSRAVEKIKELKKSIP